MTVASKHRPERERERACLTCRKSKTKCVGAVPGEEGDQGRCDKCKRLNLKCEFVELKKVGRPRKVAPPEEDGDADMRLSSDHDWMDEWTEVNAVATYDRLYQSLLAPLSPGFEVIVSPSPEYWPESSGTTFDFDFLSRSQGSPLIESKELTVGNSIYDLPLLARQYHLFVHSFLPLLSPDETQLIAYLSAAPQELLLAIVTVIDPSLGLEFTIPANDYDTTIYHLQSSILATHAAFGRGDPVRARSIVKWTQKMLLRLRWNELDAGESVRLGDRSKEELDLIRRLWYETYSVDIMLSVLTGTRPYLEFVDAQVNLPQQLYGRENSALALRTRALALLSTTTAIPTGATPLESHLSDLTSLGTNISIMAKDIYISSASLYGVEESACREAAFMASMISSAAIIFLYNSSFVPAAFTCGLDPTQRPAPETFEHIRSAGQHIFGTLRASLSSVAIETGHSPFFGCSLLIGAQGRVTTFLEDDERSNSTIRWSRAAIASDLELAEWVLTKQREKWTGVENVLDKVKELRLSVLGWSQNEVALIGTG